MRLGLWTQMEDSGRMEGRVIQLLDRIQATIATISMVKLDEHVLLSGVIDAEEIQTARLEALLWKIEGMRSVKVVSEMSTTQRMIADMISGKLGYVIPAEFAVNPVEV